MAVSQAFIFHFKCYSILYFAVCRMPASMLGFPVLIQVKVKAKELRGKSRDDLTKQLDELKTVSFPTIVSFVPD